MNEFSFPEGTEYTCDNCGKRYVAGNRNVRCLVAHPPGSCCHYTDKLVEKPQSHLGHHYGSRTPTSEELGLTRKKEP